MIFDPDAPVIKQLLKTYLGHAAATAANGTTTYGPAIIFEDAGVVWPIPPEIQAAAQRLPGFASAHEKLQVQLVLKLLVARAMEQ